MAASDRCIEHERSHVNVASSAKLYIIMQNEVSISTADFVPAHNATTPVTLNLAGYFSEMSAADLLSLYTVIAVDDHAGWAKKLRQPLCPILCTF